jgi:hypothetical protein
VLDGIFKTLLVTVGVVPPPPLKETVYLLNVYSPYSDAARPCAVGEGILNDCEELELTWYVLLVLIQFIPELSGNPELYLILYVFLMLLLPYISIQYVLLFIVLTRYPMLY